MSVSESGHDNKGSHCCMKYDEIERNAGKMETEMAKDGF